MNTDHPNLTPEHARDRLATAEARPLGRSGDAKVHASATAVFGISAAVFMASQNLFTGASDFIVSLVFVVIWFGTVAWVERAARTVPRRARLWSRLGIGASMVLALGAGLPWLNYQAQSEPNTWPMVLAVSAVVALPSLVAAAIIARGRS